MLFSGTGRVKSCPGPPVSPSVLSVTMNVLPSGRSSTTGRIVDSYTNILTVKLFARGDAERSAVRESLGWWNDSFLNLSRLITGVSVILQTMNSLLVVATAWLALLLWSQGEMTPGAVAAAIGLCCGSCRCPAG